MIYYETILLVRVECHSHDNCYMNVHAVRVGSAITLMFEPKLIHSFSTTGPIIPTGGLLRLPAEFYPRKRVMLQAPLGRFTVDIDGTLTSYNYVEMESWSATYIAGPPTAALLAM